GKERGLRGAQLWVGLARAALVAEAVGGDDAPPPASEPTMIAKAIDDHPRSAAYDQVIVGYLLQIADELKHSGGAEATALRRRTSKLVGALQPGTLRRLIEMGGDNAQRTKFAIDATHGLAVDAVLEIVRAMADASHKTVSDPLVRMLSKLAQHAEQGTAEARPQADEALREQVRTLLQGWTLEDPNPDAYGKALHRMAAASPATSARSTWQQSAEPLRIVQTALETGVLGFGAWRAIERLVAEHQVGNLVDLLAVSPSTPDVAPLSTRVASPDVRREPWKVSLRVPAEREAALLGALRDAGPRVVRVALTAALEDCPPSAVPPITQVAHDQTVASELRVLAIQVLGRVKNVVALTALLEIVDGGKNWLGRPRLAARSLELLAALMALAAGWRNDGRAATLLALAAASNDPDIRSAVS